MRELIKSHTDNLPSDRLNFEKTMLFCSFTIDDNLTKTIAIILLRNIWKILVK